MRRAIDASRSLSPRPPRLSTLLLLSLWSLASTANAQDTGERQATAQALFEQGRRLVADGKPDEACPKFAESQRLDPGVGTQFNLADCYEKLGRLASAYALYVEVAAATRQAGQGERETVARKRAAALRPRLSTLTIDVADAVELEGLEVRRDGVTVGAPQWGVPIPVDPGTHELTATAPGHEPWSRHIDVPGDAAARNVAIPSLKPLPEEPAASSVAAGRQLDDAGASRDSASFWSSPWNVAGVSLAATGVAALGVGGYFGYRALSLADESERLGCDADVCANQQALDKRNDAKAAGNVATWTSVGGGVALLSAGVLIWVVAERGGSETTVQLTPIVGGTHVQLSGVF